MGDCECLAGCAFFNDRMSNMPTMADMLKEKYCKGDSGTCARYIVFKARGRDAVPADLFPNDRNYAEQVLAATS